MQVKKYVILNKKIGETPLECAEKWRAANPLYADLPLAYAGRLDPMASGKLLILIGDECKHQTDYHNLDKEYEFQILFGLQSDTADVLGLIENDNKTSMSLSTEKVKNCLKSLVGNITLPYPNFSSKTVNGKPLHVWTLENRLNEIIIPKKSSKIFALKLNKLEIKSIEEIYKESLEKINSVTEVTEESKSLGRDFRREDVRLAWKNILEKNAGQNYQIGTFTCTASSGTYMRTLAEIIAGNIGQIGLAYNIKRNKIGRYKRLFGHFGIWLKLYK